MTPRVVFDCMIFLQGAAKPNGPAGACLHFVDDGKVNLCISAEILTELRDVLTRTKTQRRFPQLTPEWVESFLDNVTLKSKLIPAVPRLYVFDRDPKDESYINLALAAGANYLVTRDRDLLDLADDTDFRNRYPTLVILEPHVFIREIIGPRVSRKENPPMESAT